MYFSIIVTELLKTPLSLAGVGLNGIFYFKHGYFCVLSSFLIIVTEKLKHAVSLVGVSVKWFFILVKLIIYFSIIVTRKLKIVVTLGRVRTMRCF